MPICRRRPLTLLLACIVASACARGNESNPIGDANVPPRVVACRARIDSPFQFAEIALRSERNLGVNRVADRTGTERNVRLHPDGRTVVFARERALDDPDSREIFVSSTDGSRSEVRLTSNARFDDEPCWSPDGARILFASERGGARSLWLADATTGDAQQFLAPPPGASDGEPDWSRATDRIVWSRRDNSGRHALWIAQGNGAGAVPLTDGVPGATSSIGDHAPAFSPDGNRVVFVRRIATSIALLCAVDAASSVVSTLVVPDGEVGTPRWAPAGDQIWFGIAEPMRGRQTMRLATVPAAGGAVSLQWPDERWRLDGLDLTQDLPAAATGGAPVPLDVTQANVQIATGSAAFGVREQLRNVDGDEFRVATATVEDRQVAGISCRFDLPVDAAENVLELRIRGVARSNRASAGCVLRMSIYNPVDNRFDTAIELPLVTTTAQSVDFRTSSLRHLTKEKQLWVTVIADLTAGTTSELLVDQVFVEFVARRSP